MTVKNGLGLNSSLREPTTAALARGRAVQVAEVLFDVGRVRGQSPHGPPAGTCNSNAGASISSSSGGTDDTRGRRSLHEMLFGLSEMPFAFAGIRRIGVRCEHGLVGLDLRFFLTTI